MTLISNDRATVRCSDVPDLLHLCCVCTLNQTTCPFLSFVFQVLQLSYGPCRKMNGSGVSCQVDSPKGFEELRLLIKRSRDEM